jgi:hypothetical protein
VSRFLCVEVEDVDQHRAQGGAGIFDAIRLLPGVLRVVDLSVVSGKTLDVILLHRPEPKRRGGTPS